jgi:hypothetical protein
LVLVIDPDKDAPLAVPVEMAFTLLALLLGAAIVYRALSSS